MNYQAEWVEPIQIDYRDGYTFHEIPPNGQGLTALLALNIVKHFDLKGMGFGSAGSWHTQMEAIKLAFADAHAYIGDPKKVDVPVETLLSDAYTQSRLDLINADCARPPSRVIHPASGTQSIFRSPTGMATWSAGYKVFTWALAAG